MNYEIVIKIAGMLKVQDKQTGNLIPWQLHPEQIKIIKTYCENDRTLTLKGRQIGSSTVSAFLLLMHCLANPGAKAAIVADKESLSIVLLAKAAAFAEQLNIVEKHNQVLLILKNGSRIEALSAQADLRGRSYQALFLSELESWQDREVYGQLLQTCPKSAKIIAESTAAGADGLMHRLWTAEKSRDIKLFFSVEDHLEYRSDRKLTRQEIVQAREWGYSDMRAAAWFIDKMESDFQNDMVLAIREYPQLESHPFLIRSGRWITKTPKILNHTDWNGFKIFEEYNSSHRYLVGCDPSYGVGACSAAIVVIDRTTQRFVATLTDANLLGDGTVTKLQQINNRYKPDSITIENNGIGQFTVKEALKMGLPVITHNTNQHNQYAGMLLVKRAVEAGILEAGKDWADECESVTYFDSGKQKRFAGKKDMAMASAIIYPNIISDPYVIKKMDDPDIYKPELFLNKDTTWY